MKKSELKKNEKVWCWWKSRHLYYTGRIIRNAYEFIDECGAITLITEEQLAKLRFERGRLVPGRKEVNNSYESKRHSS